MSGHVTKRGNKEFSARYAADGSTVNAQRSQHQLTMFLLMKEFTTSAGGAMRQQSKDNHSDDGCTEGEARNIREGNGQNQRKAVHYEKR